MNPRGRCKKCGAPITWLRTNTGTWMPVDDEDGRVHPSELFSVESHSAHWSSCPEAAAFRKRKQQEQHAALDEANAKKATIALIRASSFLLIEKWGVRREQLQSLAFALVRVKNFENLHTASAEGLDGLLRGLQRVDVLLNGPGFEGPLNKVWDELQSLVVDEVTHAAITV